MSSFKTKTSWDFKKNWRQVEPTWDQFYLTMAYTVAERSPDKRTKMGSVITSEEMEVLSVGFNTLPMGLDIEDDQYQFRPQKYRYFIHAEDYAINQMVRSGVRIEPFCLYTQCVPCCRCLNNAIQVGIKRVVYHKQGQDAYMKFAGETHVWNDEGRTSLEIAEKCGVEMVAFNGPLANPVFGYFAGEKVVYARDDYYQVAKIKSNNTIDY